jgi:hypothetical protein
MFPAWMVSHLNLAPESLRNASVSGLGTDDGASFAYVTLDAGTLGEWTIYAGFSATTQDSMLGRLGFLDRYTAVFDYRNGTFLLESRDTNTIPISPTP